ncbi:MAG: hypothetical protein QG671_1928 [Actinomycetota bacterium]|jgi:hypothetical protein|uniref:hypothetical protein n=1 Tax=Mycolicibacterium sp. CR10 TaxID=2562314 RepID=UPI001F0CE581|nr:hypothetical protein [Mycolicibacterium sp. CR10]MDQ1306096.1 hypothetical protein [Actinomycetota bacterium]
MTKMRRSPWLDDRTALLLARLTEYEMTLPEDVVRELISDHLDTTARLMRIGRQAAKFYVTDDVIATIAHQILGIDQAAANDGVVSLAAARRRKNR